MLVVSAREATEEKVAALDLGADDYVTKPFDTEEVLARLRRALRQRIGGEWRRADSRSRGSRSTCSTAAFVATARRSISPPRNTPSWPSSPGIPAGSSPTGSCFEPYGDRRTRRMSNIYG